MTLGELSRRWNRAYYRHASGDMRDQAAALRVGDGLYRRFVAPAVVEAMAESLEMAALQMDKLADE